MRFSFLFPACLHLFPSSSPEVRLRQPSGPQPPAAPCCCFCTAVLFTWKLLFISSSHRALVIIPHSAEKHYLQQTLTVPHFSSVKSCYYKKLCILPVIIPMLVLHLLSKQYCLTFLPCHFPLTIQKYSTNFARGEGKVLDLQVHRKL